MTNAGSGWPIALLASSLIGVTSMVAEASTTTRAPTPTMAADQTGCAAVHFYDVGPGKPYTAIGQLPWSQLKGCDTVRIYPRLNNAPYQEMILASAGTNLAPTAATQFMRVIGMPDPATGALPIIDGTDATQLETLPGQAQRPLQYWDNGNPGRALYRLGLVMVSGQQGRDYHQGPPGYLSIENLDIRNAVYGGTFHDAKAGAISSYGTFTSCLYVEVGAHLVLKNNLLHNCGNGLFINSKNNALVELSQDVLVEGNRFYLNSQAAGTGGSNGFHEHNSYTEARDILFQYNVFGDVKPGAFGDCLKDRSSGLVVRYNVFASSCGIQLNLMDSTGGQSLIWGDPGYAQTYIYGNLFDIAGQTDATLAFYGGDSGTTANYRQGTLFFYNNTFTVKGDVNHGAYPSVFLFNLVMPNAVAEVKNNVFYTSPVSTGVAGMVQAMSYGHGTINLAGNWVSGNAAQFWLDHTVAGAVVNGWNSNINANNPPLFVDETQHDFRPAIGSPLIDASAALDAQLASTGNLPVGVAGAPGAIRAKDGHLDIGAFEAVVDNIFADGFEPTSRVAGP